LFERSENNLQNNNANQLTNQPIFDKTKGPIKPEVQLFYVLPKEVLKDLYKDLYQELEQKNPTWWPESNNTYNAFKWAYCKYFWESHVDFPEIDLDVLEQELDKIKLELK
jgi:hypothetical protein